MRTVLTHILILAIVLCSAEKAVSEQALIFQPLVSIYSDSDGKGLLHPEDVACRADSIVIADTGNNRLVQYGLQDNEVKFISQVHFSQLRSPIRVQITSKGEIWALSSKNRRIVRVGPDGQFLGNFELKSVPDQEEIVPRSFRIDRDDKVYILDIHGNRLLVFSAAGEFLRQIDLPKEFGSFADFVVASSGTIYTVDSIHARIHSAGPDAQNFSPLSKSLKDRMNFPTYITTDNGGNLYVTDQNGGKIILVGVDGSFRGQKAGKGRAEGLLNYPVGICLNGNGLAFVADRNNNRVQIFR
ncbi:MAG: NHL repeat-containing protein [Thermodesulfobacteriota bacterium]